MSTSPRVAAKLLALTAAAAATVSIGLAAATPAIAKPPKPVGPSVGSSVTSPTGNATAIMQRRVSPFERFENAFDKFFHIPDSDDYVAPRAAY
jgi:hypothetical protein